MGAIEGCTELLRELDQSLDLVEKLDLQDEKQRRRVRAYLRKSLRLLDFTDHVVRALDDFEVALYKWRCEFDIARKLLNEIRVDDPEGRELQARLSARGHRMLAAIQAKYAHSNV